jgi:hypothetical protein
MSVRPLLLGILLAAHSLTGCGGPARLPTHPVRGTVQYRGQPLAEAMLVLHPVKPIPEGTPQPIAYSNAQGAFEFTTFATNDGAPAGEYIITVELRAPRKVGEEVVRDGANLLPARYQSAQTSDLRCEVKPGANDLPAIVLPER